MTARFSSMEVTNFPNSSYFILAYEFFERFHHYGIRAILALFLYQDLRYSPNDASMIYHLYQGLEKFICIFGICLSDSVIGKFATIVAMSFVNLCGIIMITLSTIPPVSYVVKLSTLVGLSLVALGTGCVKPCITGFCNDQFKESHAPREIWSFFTLMFFMTTISALFSSLITPILHKEVECLGDTQCYPLAFAVCSASLMISIVFFLFGSCFYKKLRPQDNYLLLMLKIIFHALINKFLRRNNNVRRQHWLEYADDKYEKTLIEDGKIVLRILILYIPFPIYWSLLYQQGSRWVFQATHMNSIHGEWTIRADQIIMMNPLFLIVLVPLCDLLIYPCLNLLRMEKTLPKLILGGFLICISFLIAAGIVLHMENSSPDIPMSTEAHLRIFNGENCNYTVETNIPELPLFEMEHLQAFTYKEVPIDSNTFNVKLVFSSTTRDCFQFGNQTFTMNGGDAYSLFLNSHNESKPALWYSEFILPSLRGDPLVRILMNSATQHSVKFESDKPHIANKTFQSQSRDLHELRASRYEVFIDDASISNIKLTDGGVYSLIIVEKMDTFELNVIEVVAPYDLPMIWMMPQYVCMTLGEIMFTGTALEFTYDKAPKHMRIVLHVFWLLTVAMGNALTAFVNALRIFVSIAAENLLFAILMCINIYIFCVVAYYYNPNELVTQTY